MAFYKAIKGTFATVDVQMKSLTGRVFENTFVENITSPGDTNKDQTEHADGNKVFGANLSGVAFNSGLVKAVGGTVVIDRVPMTLWSGRIRKRWVMDNVTGPGDAGVTKWEEGAVTYFASLLGGPTGNPYESSSTSSEGTLTIKVNSGGEQITGESFVRSRRSRPDWTRGGVIPIQLDMVWKNDAAITSGAANLFNVDVGGTLTTILGDGDGTPGTDFQQLTGAAKLRQIDYLFDFRNGATVKVEIDALWNVNPVA